MCGRYTVKKPLKELKEKFQVTRDLFEGYQERYNVAPSQYNPVILSREGERELHGFRWGLIPPWAKDPQTSFINAKAETVHQKPSFRASFKSKRCLVPADGFIEWERRGKDKVPHYFFVPGEDLFAFAGTWAKWDGGFQPIYSFSIITTEANKLVSRFHNRMPVILNPADYDTWLSPDADTQALRDLLVSYPDKEMDQFEVSKKINSPKNDSADLLTPVSN